MSGFGDREKDFENKYAYEEKMGFKVEARCAKLFGLWAADQLGLFGQDAQTYAVDIVNTNLEKPGFKDILQKVEADLKVKNIEISDHGLEIELEASLEEARRQILQDG